VDGITGEEDQERGEERVPDEKFGRWIEGPPPPTEPWRIVEPGIEVEVRGERYLIGDCNDVLGIGAFGAEFTRDDIERWRRIDREAAYRAGREDAAREIEALANKIEEAAKAETWGRSTGITLAIVMRDAAKTARGVGVQPTEEQRAVEEDQERDEEQV
jgi:hypothetical protein